MAAVGIAVIKIGLQAIGHIVEDLMSMGSGKASLVALVLIASTGMGAADEVRLISIGGVKGALDPIVAAFSTATGNTVKYTVGAPPLVAQRLAAGEAFDVVVLSVPAMDDLDKLGGIKAETRVVVARGGIGIAVRAGAPVPDVSSAVAFKQALIAAGSIGVGDPAMLNGSGAVIQRILAASGILLAVKPKMQIVGLDPGQQMIAKGELEIGLMNASEVRSFLTFAGGVPEPLQEYTSYDAAVTTRAAASTAASALVQMIASSRAAPHWKAARMEPQAR
jgi:molybdate transport system substrate-binding protein